MAPSALRVAYQYLCRQAGLLEAPPAMHKAITEWVLATVATTAVSNHKVIIQEQQTTRRREIAERMRPLENALLALEAAPTSWKAYKEVYDNSWISGHPGTRWSVKEFQKMTPEKRADLERSIRRLIQQLRENIGYEKAYPDQEIKRSKAEISRLKPYTQSKVKPANLDHTGEATHKFPVDLTGWRYGEELAKRIEDHITTFWTGVETKMRAKGVAPPEMYAEIKEDVEFALASWKHITVKLSYENVRNARASWEERSKVLWVKMPHGAEPYELRDLSGSVRHELQHFAQTYLTYAFKGVGNMTGWEAVDKKRKPRPGMPSRHIMTPEYMQHMKETPAAKKLRIRRVRQGLPADSPPNFHALDDIEFYTDLSDGIDRFNTNLRAAGSLTTDQRRTMLKLFIGTVRWPQNRDYRNTGEWHQATEALGGYDMIKFFEPDRFFLALKARAQGKYRKAVGEIAKAVL